MIGKKAKKNIVNGIAALMVLALIGSFAVVNANKKPMAAAESNFAAGEGYLYYNDTESALWSRNAQSGETKLIGEGVKVLSACGEEVLVTNGTNAYVVNYLGENTGESYKIDGTNFYLTEKYVYYKDNETGYVMRIGRENEVKQKILKLEVNKFVVNDKLLIFITDGKSVYFYDMDTTMPAAFFVDKKITDFDMYGDYLYYSDAANKNKISRMNYLTYAEDEIEGVKTAEFVCCEGKVFYLKNAKNNKSEYKVFEKDIPDGE